VFIRWIVIYPVDSAIHRLNNWGQVVVLALNNRKQSDLCLLFIQQQQRKLFAHNSQLFCESEGEIKEVIPF